MRKATGFNRDELKAVCRDPRGCGGPANPTRDQARRSRAGAPFVRGWPRMLRTLAHLSDGFARFAAVTSPTTFRVTPETSSVASPRKPTRWRQPPRLSEHRDRTDWLRGDKPVCPINCGRARPDGGRHAGAWFLARWIGAQVGAVYTKNDEGIWTLAAHYAMAGKPGAPMDGSIKRDREEAWAGSDRAGRTARRHHGISTIRQLDARKSDRDWGRRHPALSCSFRSCIPVEPPGSSSSLFSSLAPTKCGSSSRRYASC
jgi:hypothetical protein